MPTRYRCAELETFPLGRGTALTYSRASRIAKSLTPLEIRLLRECRNFCTLDEHTLNWCQSRHSQGLRELSRARLPGPLARFIERLLSHLEKRSGEIAVGSKEFTEVKRQIEAHVQAGFLVSDVDLVEACKKAVPPGEKAASIEFLAIATRDRPETLRRGLSSYINNARDYDRPVQFLVVDDAIEPDAQQSTREMLELLARESAAKILYTSREDRCTFADQLAAASGVAPDLVRFALLGDESAQRTLGSCYNTLLLETASHCLVVADDDTLCETAVPPNQQEDPALTSHYDPTEFWFFLSRQEAFDAAAVVPRDFLQGHESLLGRSIGSCFSDVASPELLDLDQMRPSFDTRLRFHGGRVVSTSAGIFGDSGVGTTGYLYVNPSSRSRLTRTEEEYLAFVESRQVFRAVTRPTISEGIFCMSGNLGLDNRRLLPPFPPVERGADGVFAAALRKCFRDSYLGYVPWAVKHDPPHHRAQPLSKFMENAKRVRFSEVLRQLIQAGPPVSTGGEGGAALRRLGAYLRDVASISLADFEETLKITFWKVYSDGYLQAEKRSPDPAVADFYEKYRRQHREITRKALQEPDYFVPRDMAGAGTDEQIRSLLQKRVRQYGELLEVWPDLVAAAQDLSNRGVRLTREIQG